MHRLVPDPRGSIDCIVLRIDMDGEAKAKEGGRARDQTDDGSLASSATRGHQCRNNRFYERAYEVVSGVPLNAFFRSDLSLF